MKSLLKIYGKYIASTWLIIMLLGAVNLVIFGWVVVERAAASDGMMTGGMRNLEQTVFASEQKDDFTFCAGAEGELRERNIIFLFILNEAGDVIFSWQLPDELKEHYTAGEIAAFSRYYLEDYPVRVWRGERGLLVAGGPKDSVWKYSVELSMDFINNMGRYAKGFLTANLLIIASIIGILGYSFYRSLRPLSRGIGELSQNRKIRLKQKGITAELAGALNRTSDILENQRQDLSRRDMARTEWIAGVSHDIRTPLSLIMGYADELEQQEELSKEQRKKARLIKNQSIRIRQLIEDLNLTSKLAYQMQPLRLTRVFPGALLRLLAAEAINEGMPEAYELEVQVQEDLEGVFVEGDEELMKRALRNLLHNAVRHNPKGCRIILSGSRQLLEGRTFAVLRVEDDGAGIPEEIRRILESGEEGADVREAQEEKELLQTEKKPHIMGLRIVKQIVLAHRGSFSIEKEGRCVTLAFPAASEVSGTKRISEGKTVRQHRGT